jgi:hypothetical protein
MDRQGEGHQAPQLAAPPAPPMPPPSGTAPLASEAVEATAARLVQGDHDGGGAAGAENAAGWQTYTRGSTVTSEAGQAAGPSPAGPSPLQRTMGDEHHQRTAMTRLGEGEKESGALAASSTPERAERADEASLTLPDAGAATNEPTIADMLKETFAKRATEPRPKQVIPVRPALPMLPAQPFGGLHAPPYASGSPEGPADGRSSASKPPIIGRASGSAFGRPVISTMPPVAPLAFAVSETAPFQSMPPGSHMGIKADPNQPTPPPLSEFPSGVPSHGLLDSVQVKPEPVDDEIDASAVYAQAWAAHASPSALRFNARAAGDGKHCDTHVRMKEVGC